MAEKKSLGLLRAGPLHRLQGKSSKTELPWGMLKKQPRHRATDQRTSSTQKSAKQRPAACAARSVKVPACRSQPAQPGRHIPEPPCDQVAHFPLPLPASVHRQQP